jgi:NitT/TauT family transport system substrate-binding protein
VNKTRVLPAAIAATILLLTGCGTAGAPAATTASGGALSKIKIQLQWFYQAQFAGYIAAVDQGFYREQGLDVQLLEGGTDIVPQTVLAQGKADYAVAWVPKALASREQGANITDVAQIFARSGTYQVAWKGGGITAPVDFKGKKIGNWGFGNEFELFAGMTKAGLDPGRDVTLVQQQFDMQALLKKEIDAAQAMSYNEYAQLLEATNPETDKLYTPDDFTIIDWKRYGSAMLQDAVWANTDKLKDPAYRQQTVKFLLGTIKGWAFCRDNPDKCRDMVVAKGSKLGRSHQLWQTNEVNKLIWPSKDGIGVVDAADWKQTVDISMNTRNQTGDTVLKKAPEGLAYTNDYIDQAITAAKTAGIDVSGASFRPETVTLQAGGA